MQLQWTKFHPNHFHEIILWRNSRKFRSIKIRGSLYQISRKFSLVTLQLQVTPSSKNLCAELPLEIDCIICEQSHVFDLTLMNSWIRRKPQVLIQPLAYNRVSQPTQLQQIQLEEHPQSLTSTYGAEGAIINNLSFLAHLIKPAEKSHTRTLGLMVATQVEPPDDAQSSARTLCHILVVLLCPPSSSCVVSQTQLVEETPSFMIYETPGRGLTTSAFRKQQKQDPINQRFQPI